MVQFLFKFTRVWLGIAVTVNLIALAGKITQTGSFWTALMGVLAWFNPGNTNNFIAEVVLFFPAVGAYLLAGRLAARPPPR
jgi:hypothetical protein